MSSLIHISNHKIKSIFSYLYIKHRTLILVMKSFKKGKSSAVRIGAALQNVNKPKKMLIMRGEG